MHRAPKLFIGHLAQCRPPDSDPDPDPGPDPSPHPGPDPDSGPAQVSTFIAEVVDKLPPISTPAKGNAFFSSGEHTPRPLPPSRRHRRRHVAAELPDLHVPPVVHGLQGCSMAWLRSFAASPWVARATYRGPRRALPSRLT
eukprot:scaffold66375_cov66-Phaeocystis_antarctica.AAC.1